MRSALAFGLLPVLAFLPACSSSSNSKPIGPVFDASTGVPDVATDHVPDTGRASDARGDHSTSSGGDSGVKHDAKGGGGPEAGHDASQGDVSAPIDSGSDVSDTGTTQTDAHDSAAPPSGDAGICPGGTGAIALVGGGATTAFGAVSTNGGAFVTQTFSNQTVSAPPAVVTLGGGAFLGVYPTTANDVIMSTAYTAASGWSAPVAIAALAGKDAAATEQGGPSLAVLGSSAELVYYGSNSSFYHGIYASGMWGPASDLVGGAVTQDDGPSQPTAATAGSTLYVAFDGNNHGLYVDSWTVAGGWAGAGAVMGAGVGAVPPTLVALTGGTADLMLVFEQQNSNFLYSVLHTPGTGWAAPVQVNATATATKQASLAPLPSGGVVMVYEGTNSLPYASVFSPGASPVWTTPISINPESVVLPTPPTVASGGACGVDAVVAMVQPTGVAIVTLHEDVWSPPTIVTTLAGMSFASIALGP